MSNTFFHGAKKFCRVVLHSCALLVTGLIFMLSRKVPKTTMQTY